MTKNKKAPQSIPLGVVFSADFSAIYEIVAVNGDGFCHRFGLGCLQKGESFMNTQERRIHIVQIIAACGTVSAQELANRMRVTSRTIMRDIKVLTPLYPISVNYGRGGGYYIMNYKALNLPCLKNFELELLRKISIEIDVFSSCSLTPEENQVLKDMVSTYSIQRNIKYE